MPPRAAGGTAMLRRATSPGPSTPGSRGFASLSRLCEGCGPDVDAR
jgi:hypothetical protein